MKFALLHEPSLAGDDSGQSPTPYERLHESLVRVGIAEEVGFHSVWSFDPEPSPVSNTATAPEIWLSAVAAQTTSIRIGHGVPLHPYGYHNPIRTAEMASVLDIVSNGRLEFGSVMARGAMVPGKDAAPPWDEALRMLPRMWTDEAFSWESATFQMPLCEVHPKPIQDPHPPLWICGADRDSAIRAGKRGLGYLHAGSSDAAETEACVVAYRDAITDAAPIGEFVNEQFAWVTPVFCEAAPIGERRPRRPARADSPPGPNHGSYEGTAIRGDPERCIEQIETIAGRGIDLLVVRSHEVSTGHDALCASLRLIGREVIPYFAG
jgi:alkanesulfonate monooxygenase SsuD/methylene tetrahydromethanopterin reductase-like flavin-dependent oxidoreductase (luciferase family)